METEQIDLPRSPFHVSWTQKQLFKQLETKLSQRRNERNNFCLTAANTKARAKQHKKV